MVGVYAAAWTGYQLSAGTTLTVIYTLCPSTIYQSQFTHPQMHVFGLEAGVPGENVQTPHRKNADVQGIRAWNMKPLLVVK